MGKSFGVVQLGFLGLVIVSVPHGGATRPVNTNLARSRSTVMTCMPANSNRMSARARQDAIVAHVEVIRRGLPFDQLLCRF